MGGGRLRLTRYKRTSLSAAATAGLLAAGLLTATPAAAAIEPPQPNIPSNLTIEPAPKNGTGGSDCGWVRRSIQGVVLSATLSTPEPAGGINAVLRLQDVTAPGSPWTEKTTDVPVANNSNAQFYLGQLEDGHTYNWTVQARVQDKLSDVATGCRFTVDTTSPQVVVTSTDFPSNGSPPRKGIGQTGVIHIAPAPGTEDIVCYRLSLGDIPVGTPCTATPDASGKYDLKLTPSDWGTYDLRVDAIDRAGNFSWTTSYRFYVPYGTVDPWTVCDTVNGHKLCGPMLDRYQELKQADANYPAPAGDVVATRDGAGRYVALADGSQLVWSIRYGVHPVATAATALWAGGDAWFGYPTEDPRRLDARGYTQQFERATVSWTPETGAHTTFGGIGSAWGVSLLGYPTGEESDMGDGRGRKQTFEKGVIVWSPQTDARPLIGEIGRVWLRNPFAYGYPRNQEAVLGDGVGRRQEFENVMIYWSPRTGAHEVHGGIWTRWWQLGNETGFLGYPVSDESSLGRSRYNEFERGTIYWTADGGAHEMHGGIRARWIQIGGPEAVGFPVTDEMPTSDGRGRYQVFDHGSIFWTPQTGAVELYGGINAAWASQGWNSGRLGYPTVGEYPVPGGRRGDFEGGYILWVQATGRTEIHYY
ncbi:LGFP repeat-containing protein [Yinghuangia seranimata]|uniref:LGFP repeat-containing protein n=1 Tax=Yinghuangia seranimata TaxID=408067 RepID=UPI00248AA63D|nr:hypothetical protein [Yinghuangia seranimata]MDI2132830.1 hypothetical protein [Yinghuangia seranimata]